MIALNLVNLNLRIERSAGILGRGPQWIHLKKYALDLSDSKLNPASVGQAAVT